MSTKKQKKVKELEAKRKKRRKRIFFLSLLLSVSIGFLIFFFISLFDYIYPPVTREGHEARQKEKFQIYFADGNERFLVTETRYLPKRDKPEDQALEIVRALAEGPKLGATRTLPKEAAVREIRFDKDGTAVVDFDRGLVDHHPGGSTSEVMTVYSLVHSLTENFSTVKSVRILVDGKEQDSLKGQIDLRGLFHPKRDLLPGGAPPNKSAAS